MRRKRRHMGPGCGSGFWGPGHGSRHKEEAVLSLWACATGLQHGGLRDLLLAMPRGTRPCPQDPEAPPDRSVEAAVQLAARDRPAGWERSRHRRTRSCIMYHLYIIRFWPSPEGMGPCFSTACPHCFHVDRGTSNGFMKPFSGTCSQAVGKSCPHWSTRLGEISEIAATGGRNRVPAPSRPHGLHRSCTLAPQVFHVIFTRSVSGPARRKAVFRIWPHCPHPLLLLLLPKDMEEGGFGNKPPLFPGAHMGCWMAAGGRLFDDATGAKAS